MGAIESPRWRCLRPKLRSARTFRFTSQTIALPSRHTWGSGRRQALDSVRTQGASHRASGTGGTRPTGISGGESRW
eukprot:6908144-Pyramimonas_sp.AAC.1